MSWALFRSVLNAKIASFQAKRSDTDCDGSVFVLLLWLFLLALTARYTLVILTNTPIGAGNAAGDLSLAALSLALSLATGRGHLAEATLLLRAATIGFLATPWTMSCCAIVFHIGRQSNFVDDLLVAGDRLLGFDWLAYTRYVDRSPIIWPILKVAYRSILYQVQIVCVVLAFTRSATRLYVFLCAQFWSLVVVAGIAIFLPAVGTFITFGAPQDIVHQGDFLPPDWVVSTITHLRDTSYKRVIEPIPLITFPSYHACSATLFAWALWKTPYVRWLALTLNLAMLAATPALGCHYLVDVLAGCTIAVLTVSIASAAIHRLAPVGEVRLLLAPEKSVVLAPGLQV